ncbi:MAG: hypothetical protein ACRDHM_11460 [Actinomycetota bacterium]
MSATFQRFAGVSAILVGVGGLIYGVLFGAIVYGAGRPVALAWLTLGLLGAALATPVAVALYMKLRETDWGFALLALLLGLAGSLGQVQNSALTLAKEVGELIGESPDPAGVFRFGLIGISLLVFGWLILQGDAFPKRLGYLAEAGGVLLVLTFVGRVTGLIDTANELTVLPPVLYGVLVHPVFYVWLGRVLRKDAG